ncbi:MAG: HEAT repeat domain-containing protein, partial [Planctomycetota bacterium]
MTLDEVIEQLQSAHDEATVEFAADALSSLELDAEKLAALTWHRYLSVRRAAVRAIAAKGGLNSFKLVTARLADGHGLMRRDAARALGRLGDPSAVPHLESLLRNDRKAFVREAASESLGVLGGRAALDALRGHLGIEREAGVRRALVEAIGGLAHHQPLALDALGALAVQVGRETDPLVKHRAVALLLDRAKGRAKDDLVAAFRAVPQAGREPLANALAERARELDPALASLVDELRSQPLETAALTEFGSDLTGRVKRGHALTYGRDREVELARARLFAESGPRSVVLVGPSGAGKTAIVEEIARRFANETRVVPTIVLEVTTGDILAGTRYLGEWQTRLKKLLTAVRSPHRVVIYVPDVNQLLEAGRASDTQQNFASMIAPYLERGEIAILGESTPEAFRRGLERDQPFRKLFQVIQIESMSQESALDVLHGVGRELAQDARERRDVSLSIAEDAYSLALDHGAAYFPGLARPGNGLKLLRESVTAALASGQSDGTAVLPPVALITGA